MQKTIVVIMMIVGASILPRTAHALTVSSTVGDIDGFGTGVEDGDLILPWDVVAEGDDDPLTDTIIYGPQTLFFDYDLSGFGEISSATLTLFTGGQGLGLSATTELYVDGVYMGFLSDGELGLASFARKDIFDISAISAIFDGNAVVEIRVKYGVDAWVLDYGEITFIGSASNVPEADAPTDSVPEPATLSLLGIGAIGLFLRSHRIAI